MSDQVVLRDLTSQYVTVGDPTPQHEAMKAALRAARENPDVFKYKCIHDDLEDENIRVEDIVAAYFAEDEK